MHIVDWSILIGVTCFFAVMAIIASKYNRSVSDFLAASRCGGRYIMGVADGMADLGAITVIAMFEIYYDAGFTAAWWYIMQFPIMLIIPLTGWLIYRYRETRVYTLAQFFEIRYSKNFRVFCGIVGVASGILNFGIFPAIAARFFIYFCGLPQHFEFLGLSVPMFPVFMIIILGISLFFTFVGGQIAIIVTDYCQGIFAAIAFVAVLIFLMWFFQWSDIVEALKTAPAEESRLHPFHTAKSSNFNPLYFIIGIAPLFFYTLIWQGRQAYNCSAISAHEAKMAKVLGQWRAIVLMFMAMVFIPVCIYTLMNHDKYADIAEIVSGKLSLIEGKNLRKQMTVSIGLREILPMGLIGTFTAMMMAATVSTHDTYLHSWGSIFVQDVIMPFRKKPFTPEQHMKALKLSIFGVALFIFLFSLFFAQKVPILMFFQITGAIFMGGAGAVTAGGLYWKRGTTPAAWASMITGSTLAVTGVIIQSKIGDDFFLTGMEMAGIAMAASIIVYVLVSLLGPRKVFNMDKMLHRGKYRIVDSQIEPIPAKGIKGFITSEFTRSDKFIYALVIVWILGLFGIFIVGTVWHFIQEMSDDTWASFWSIYVYASIATVAVTLVWFLIGGVNDLKKMFKSLALVKRNDADDGTVRNHQDLDEIQNEIENV